MHVIFKMDDHERIVDQTNQMMKEKEPDFITTSATELVMALKLIDPILQSNRIIAVPNMPALAFRAFVNIDGNIFHAPRRDACSDLVWMPDLSGWPASHCDLSS